MQSFNKKTLLIFLIVILIICTLLWIFLPTMNNKATVMPLIDNENKMHSENNIENFKEHTNNSINEQDKNKPFVDPKTGTIIDGPGFEKGDVEGVPQEVMENIPSNYYYLDDGASGEYSIVNNLCSKSCCSEQWPLPFKQKMDPYVCANKSQFVPSSYFCSNSFQDAGCLCLTKDQSQFIANRGGSGREWF